MEEQKSIDEISKSFTVDSTDTGAILTIFDREIPLEAGAMVQALNSRSSGGFSKNFAKVLKSGYANFMQTTYVNYGHKSVADLGSTTICYDGVSMLFAKALQDHPLYNGQETSTRYVETTKLGCIDPINTENSRQIMQQWFDFYLYALPKVIEHIRENRPRKEHENEKDYDKTVEKRAYDILGAFLPAGAKTNVSWHSTLRQMDDKLTWLRHHPLVEVNELALKTLEMLETRYPNTFKKDKTFEEIADLEKRKERLEHYKVQQEWRSYYMDAIKLGRKGYFFKDQCVNTWRGEFLHIGEMNLEFVKHRPIKTELPKEYNQMGMIRYDFNIDFRSYRDLQRQRSAMQRMPVLTTGIGFENWYLDQLPPDVRARAENLLVEQERAIERLTSDELTRQYYIAMGYQVSCQFTLGLAHAVYVVELRSQTTVHPTARKIALWMGKSLKEFVDAHWFTLYLDESPDDLDMRRAKQDFIEK